MDGLCYAQAFALRFAYYNTFKESRVYSYLVSCVPGKGSGQTPVHIIAADKPCFLSLPQETLYCVLCICLQFLITLLY